MRVKDLVKLCNSSINEYNCKLLIADLINKSHLLINNHLEDTITNDEYNLFKSNLEKLNNNYPVQYILGYTNFYGYKFLVNENVLIPRFETEELVDYTYNFIKDEFNNNVSILDVGCGSGAISITLSKLLKISVDAVDISEEAINVAKKNNELLEGLTFFKQSDLFKNISKKYDVITTNLPYISYDDEVDSSVSLYEPHSALYAEEDGLLLYEEFFKCVNNYLNDKYLISLEHGSTQKDKIIEIINKYMDYDEIITKKDLQNRDRMIFIIKR